MRAELVETCEEYENALQLARGETTDVGNGSMRTRK